VVKRQFFVSSLVSAIHIVADEMLVNVHNVEVQFFTKQLWSTFVIVSLLQSFCRCWSVSI